MKIYSLTVHYLSPGNAPMSYVLPTIVAKDIDEAMRIAVDAVTIQYNCSMAWVSSFQEYSPI